MTRLELLQLMRAQTLAVQASVAATGAPQAAVVGIVVSDAFDVFWDTLDSTRKAHNLARDPRVAFVIGGLLPGEEQTVQFEGVVDQPTGDELRRLQALYFARFPDGPARQTWPGLIYLRARPTWIRVSDFRGAAPIVQTFDAETLADLL